MTIQSYVRVGVVALRTEVTRLRELLRNKDLCVQQHIAERMARNMNENPSDNVVSLWRREAKRAYRLKATLAKEKAAALEAQATEWESRLASGALMREDPDEGPSFRRQASKRTSDTTAWTGGRAGSRGQWRKAHLTGRRRSPFIPRGPPLKSAPHIVHPGDTLRGTVLGSTVELPKLGEVPYAQLAIDKLRMEATQLYAKWKDKDEYVKCRIASHMHEGNNRSPREEDIRQWIVSAKHTYCRHGRVRIQEAAVLQELADNLERRAEAEGLMVRSSQESPAHGSESAGGLQAAESERVSGGPSHTPVPARSEMTFAHLAIQNLRKEAQNIEASWLRDEALFIAERAAYRMARANDPSPSPAVLLQWQYTDKSYFQTQCTAHLQKARDLRRQADALEVELESLLSSPSGHAPDPSLGTESTGKRQRKRKHLSQSSAESSGRHPLHGAATATPTSLWLTPVSGFPLRAPRRCSKRRRVASGPGSASPASLQLHPTEAASEKASGHSLPTPVPATLSTGVPLPPAALALSTTTPLHPAGSGSSAGVPAAPQPKKRRLLDFVSAQAAAHQLAPQMHTPPPGQISGTSTQIPFEHLPLGPREASGPSLTSFLSTGHATPFGPVSEIIPPRCLPLKKRPLREPAATIQSPTADVATSGPRRVSSDSLTVSSTSSGSHSQAPASTDSPAPTSAPHGVRGVGPRIRRGAPEPR
ncbi:KRUF family protein [Toxoplasma gondii VEG]|nr:KRUF family protein [Toxoplasma gondii VEG]